MIYKLKTDTPHYKELDLVIDDFIESRPENTTEDAIFDFALENTQMADWWPTPDTELIGSQANMKTPDISLWVDASLVLSPRAYRLLGDTLKPSGEFLPITVGKEVFYIFNCLITTEADEDASEIETFNGEVVSVTKVAFKPESIESKLIFKSPFQGCLSLYCSEYLITLINDFELLGLQTAAATITSP